MKIAIVNNSLEITGSFLRMDSAPTERLTSLLAGRAVIDSPNRNGCAQISILPQSNKIPRGDINSALSGTLPNQNGRFVEILIVAEMAGDDPIRLYELTRTSNDEPFNVATALENPDKSNAGELRVLSGFLNKPIESTSSTASSPISEVDPIAQSSSLATKPPEKEETPIPLSQEEKLLVLFIETLDILKEFSSSEISDSIEVSDSLSPTALSSVIIPNDDYREKIIDIAHGVIYRTSHSEAIELVSQIATNPSLITDQNRNDLLDVIINQIDINNPFLNNLLKNPNLITQDSFDDLVKFVTNTNNPILSSSLSRNTALYEFGQKSADLIAWARENKKHNSFASSICTYLKGLGGNDSTSEETLLEETIAYIVDPELELERPPGVNDEDLLDTESSDDEIPVSELDIGKILDALINGKAKAIDEAEFLAYFFPSELPESEKKKLIERLTDPRMEYSYIAERLASPAYGLIPNNRIPKALAEWAIQNSFSHNFAKKLTSRADFPKRSSITNRRNLKGRSLTIDSDTNPEGKPPIPEVKTLGDEAIGLIVSLKSIEDLKSTKIANILLAYKIKRILSSTTWVDAKSGLINLGQNPIFSRLSEDSIASLVNNAINNPDEPFNVGLGLNKDFFNVVPFKLKMKILRSSREHLSVEIDNFYTNAIKTLQGVEPHTESDILSAKMKILQKLCKGSTSRRGRSNEQIHPGVDNYEICDNPETILDHPFNDNDKPSLLQKLQSSQRENFVYVFYAAQIPDLITKKNVDSIIAFCKKNPNHNFSIGFAQNITLYKPEIFPAEKMRALEDWAREEDASKNGFANSLNLRNNDTTPKLTDFRVNTSKRDEVNSLFEISQNSGEISLERSNLNELLGKLQRRRDGELKKSLF